jgi:hypothetical protein
MSDYTKATNFATKDALVTGNPLKTLSGTELDDEFNNIVTAIATKANSSNATLTGTPTAPTAATTTNSTQLATTAFTQANITVVQTAIALKANIASPTFTGTPAAPTATAGTNTTQLATTAFVTAATPTAATINALAYPIGSVYTAIVSTNPATLLGVGTWAAFGAGRVLVGLNAADADFDTVEETGGTKTHVLTTAEMPSHKHDVNTRSGGGNDNQPQRELITSTNLTSATLSASTLDTTSVGSGDAHTIVQPYITVYFWKRTA